jgi:hypothetical protein
MRVPEEPVCIDLFRQNPVFTSLHLKSPVHVVPPQFVLSQSLQSLMEGHNWFLNQFVEIPWRSIIVCFLSLSVKAGLNLPPFEISCSWLHFGPAVPTKKVCASK